MKKTLITSLTIVVSFLAICKVNAQANYYRTTFDRIISSVNNIQAFDKTENSLIIDKKQVGIELLNILLTTNSSNLKQCAAAFYLGEIGVTNVADQLANKIVLQLYPSNAVILSTDEMLLKLPDMRFPAFDALIKIGNPSLPAVIKNLAESDDTKVRQLSLEVIERIDNDKDISALRLQKAIKAETDPQKQARLQAALKALM